MAREASQPITLGEWDKSPSGEVVEHELAEAVRSFLLDQLHELVDSHNWRA